MKEARVIGLHVSKTHSFSKFSIDQANLIEGIGIEGDCHAGVTVQHRSRVAQDPTQVNLRQVHLIHGELFDELRDAGFQISPGDMGENITTDSINLLDLPRGTKLKIGLTVVLEITGLRNPCKQLDNFKSGLMKELIYKNDAGEIVRKAGIMAIVLNGGKIVKGDSIEVELPPLPHEKLERV
ncbi:MOSC domain-containing protein [Pseudobacteriovorax antillogorgiicola]|uniref:MOSC domain-containing protein YiiM n=1 Tax=Pseudobacteriovorax antillogorgiicola TaxID=1513793 RepID=A0A1Y6CKK3_9BACT|nr:MOSC domain-containing protein [Pseudobacteriovorax antillogorgiicola]TCS45675.1 MOSC domain-containing protein YiiM [Pseudobacteriovorax antillogorgiicola]SMF73125.1 MOSC domain-containing protein YiiM [Pseudobacteriovorax antillogorgiicola]